MTDDKEIDAASLAAREAMWKHGVQFGGAELDAWVRAALAAADKVRAEGFDSVELPDDLREPLHSLRADLDWLVARIHTEDDEVASLCKDSIRTRLSHIEEASYRLAAGLAKSEADRAALVEVLADIASQPITGEDTSTKHTRSYDGIVKLARAALALVRKGA